MAARGPLQMAMRARSEQQQRAMASELKEAQDALRATQAELRRRDGDLHSATSELASRAAQLAAAEARLEAALSAAESAQAHSLACRADAEQRLQQAEAARAREAQLAEELRAREAALAESHGVRTQLQVALFDAESLKEQRRVLEQQLESAVQERDALREERGAQRAALAAGALRTTELAPRELSAKAPLEDAPCGAREDAPEAAMDIECDSIGAEAAEKLAAPKGQRRPSRGAARRYNPFKVFRFGSSASRSASTASRRRSKQGRKAAAASRRQEADQSSAGPSEGLPSSSGVPASSSVVPPEAPEASESHIAAGRPELSCARSPGLPVANDVACGEAAASLRMAVDPPSPPVL